MEKIAFIVDDDLTYSQFITTFLTSYNYKVICYGNGTDCMRNLHLNPSVIILDHNLNHEVDGLDLLRLIKSEKPEIPIIFLSGQQDVTKAIQAMKLGSIEYIEKNSGTLIQLKNIIEELERKQKKGFGHWIKNLL
jgi:FixJ family two-component response regulator